MLSAIEARALGAGCAKGNMTMTYKSLSVAETFANQVAYCRQNDAPITARICDAIINVIDHNSQFGARVLNWQGDPVLDALPLRCTAAFHGLFLAGDAPGLAELYAGEPSAMTNAEFLIAAALARHDAVLSPWLDGPPQTNEAGRSASFIAALHYLSSRTTAKFELNEIGSSAGMNLLIDRYQYDLGGVNSGPANAHIAIKPQWNGPPPPADPFTIADIHGSDIQPIDASDEASAARLQAYIWPDAPERFKRMAAGIAMIRERPVDLIEAEAADFVEMRLSQPQAEGITRVLMHSIVWQYLPESTQSRINSAMEQAACTASPNKPLAWIELETNRATFRHELKVRYWPGGDEEIVLGEAHAHGSWINWLGG
jgi:hypothetical protein